MPFLNKPKLRPFYHFCHIVFDLSDTDTYKCVKKNNRNKIQLTSPNSGITTTYQQTASNFINSLNQDQEAQMAIKRIVRRENK